MRVVVIGATGKIGSAIVSAFKSAGDEVIGVSRSSTPAVNLEDTASLTAFFNGVGAIDAVVTAAGHVPFTHLTEATPEQFATGFASKLGGQIGALLAALPHLSDGGSFTLTTGILANHAIPGSVITAAVNNGLEGFVQRAALDMPRGIRINAVNPTIVLNTGETSDAFMGYHPVTPEEAAQGYLRSAHGIETGQVYRVW